jgi:hypothetical protein
MMYSGAPRHSMLPGRGREFPGGHDQKVHAGFVGARLAGEGALKDAFAGKPGAYKSGFFSERNSRHQVRDLDIALQIHQSTSLIHNPTSNVRRQSIFTLHRIGSYFSRQAHPLHIINSHY